MSNENAFRELKFSPGQLVIVFLAILVLGVFVFLLGISVGKKQTLIKAQAGPAAVEVAKTEDLSAPIRVGEFVTTTAPVETKADPNAAAAAAGLKPEKTEAKPAEPPGTKAAEKPELKAKPAENKPAEAKTEPKPAPAAAYKSAPYYVQIGAVEGRAAAEAFAKRVSGLGFPTLVLDPFATDKKPVFRVRVGPYPSKTEASDAQAELAAALKKKTTDFFLVKT